MRGRWVLGGGCDLGDAVPRAWTQLLAVCSGGALTTSTRLRAHKSATVIGRPAPGPLGDGAVPTWVARPERHDPEHPLDVSVAETHAALRTHGRGSCLV